MKDMFFMGGPLFMGILSLLFVIMLSWITFHFIRIYFSKDPLQENAIRKIWDGKSIGLFAMIFGILGQLLGLYQAFSVIAEAGNISPNLIYGGIKVSMIPTLYGIIIYLVSILLCFVASALIDKKLD